MAAEPRIPWPPTFPIEGRECLLCGAVVLKGSKKVADTTHVDKEKYKTCPKHHFRKVTVNLVLTEEEVMCSDMDTAIITP
jgi:hypothetical protein